MKHVSRLLIATLLVFGTQRVWSSQTEDLVGRWRSDTADTGYWIVEYYVDGRFARKAYAAYDLNKPAEIVMDWGRWQINHRKYSEILDGTTSTFLQKFVGKRLTWQIASLRTDRFIFDAHDGGVRDERRTNDETPLAEVEIKSPDGAILNRAVDTVTPALHTIPSWVKAASHTSLPNHTPQQTVHAPH